MNTMRATRCAVNANRGQHHRNDSSTPIAAGRVQTILIMRLTGVTCLFTMGLHPSLWRITWFIVPIVLLRSGVL